MASEQSVQQVATALDEVAAEREREGDLSWVLLRSAAALLVAQAGELQRVKAEREAARMQAYEAVHRRVESFSERLASERRAREAAEAELAALRDALRR